MKRTSPMTNDQRFQTVSWFDGLIARVVAVHDTVIKWYTERNCSWYFSSERNATDTQMKRRPRPYRELLVEARSRFQDAARSFISDLKAYPPPPSYLPRKHQRFLLQLVSKLQDRAQAVTVPETHDRAIAVV